MKLITIALIASAFFLSGCDNETPVETPQAAAHQNMVHNNYTKLKNDVENRFVRYDDIRNIYYIDTKTRCEYVNFGGDIRTGYILIHNSCEG